KLSVDADVIPRAKAQSIANKLAETVFPKLKQEFPGLSMSFEGRQADMRDSVKSLNKGLILALLSIYALLAIPFRSYFQPLIIMTAIPFGIVGAIIGHILMGYDLSLISLFGLVALTGVVVNDSLVLIDFANQRIAKGIPLIQAVQEAGVARFRAILLTTLTTFGGLMPIIFETERQARFLIPMAISLGFGILFSTFITLLFIPILYVILEDVFNIFGFRTRSVIPSQE
ncbi:MAG: efflux RND transporter permease subunit, partial [Lentisphaerae bacterium]